MKKAERPNCYCTFYLGDRFFGFPVDAVQEVLPYQEMTVVPLAPPQVKGLINLRGQIVAAVDLRTCIGIPPREDGRLPMNVVLRIESGLVSLLVDAVGDVLEVTQESFEETPRVVLEEYRSLIRAVHKLPDSLLLVLDPEKVAACEVRK